MFYAWYLNHTTTKGRTMKYNVEFDNFDPDKTNADNASLILTYGGQKYSVCIEGGRVTELMLNSEKDTTYISPDHYGVFMVTDGKKVATIEALLDDLLKNLGGYVDGELIDIADEEGYRGMVRGIG